MRISLLLLSYVYMLIMLQTKTTIRLYHPTALEQTLVIFGIDFQSKKWTVLQELIQKCALEI